MGIGVGDCGKGESRHPPPLHWMSSLSEKSRLDSPQRRFRTQREESKQEKSFGDRDFFLAPCNLTKLLGSPLAANRTAREEFHYLSWLVICARLKLASRNFPLLLAATAAKFQRD